jgi:hypothetical protein
VLNITFYAVKADKYNQPHILYCKDRLVAELMTSGPVKEIPLTPDPELPWFRIEEIGVKDKINVDTIKGFWINHPDMDSDIPRHYGKFTFAITRDGSVHSIVGCRDEIAKRVPKSNKEILVVPAGLVGLCTALNEALETGCPNPIETAYTTIANREEDRKIPDLSDRCPCKFG